MQTHSARQFTQWLIADLEQGRSILVLFPGNTEYSALWQGVHDRLWRRDCDIVSVWLPDLPAGEMTPNALGDALGAKWASAQTLRTVENLVACGNLPEVVRLQGFEQLGKDLRKEWLAVVRRWAAAAKSLEAQGRHPTALCMIAYADSLPGPPPTPDVWLDVRWWWAIPSALEMRILCRYGDGVMESEPDLRARWREHIMPSLVGNDIELTQFLWDDLAHDTAHILGRLHEWAGQKGWTPQSLRSWGLDKITDYDLPKSSRGASEPSRQQRALWTHGLLNWTPEYGSMLSAAALAVLGASRAVEHRLWRGQVPLLLPLIDGLRLSLCERWTARYGPGWAWRWRLPLSPEEAEAVQSNPLASEWGHIETLLNSRDELRRERASLPIVSHARYVRNRLAHYQPVTFQDFEVLWYGRI